MKKIYLSEDQKYGLFDRTLRRIDSLNKEIISLLHTYDFWDISTKDEKKCCQTRFEFKVLYIKPKQKELSEFIDDLTTISHGYILEK